MVPAAAVAAPAVWEKNIAANNWKLVPFRQGTGFFSPFAQSAGM